MLNLPGVPRSLDDVMAGLIRFTLGGRPFAMVALPMAAHDRWQDGVDQRLQGAIGSVDPADRAGLYRGLAEAFRTNEDALLEALVAYDRDRVLPPVEEIRELATRAEIIRAIQEVRAVGGDPLGTAALMRLPTPTTSSPPAPEPTNGARPSTGGRRRRSARP